MGPSDTLWLPAYSCSPQLLPSIASSAPSPDQLNLRRVNVLSYRPEHTAGNETSGEEKGPEAESQELESKGRSCKGEDAITKGL